MNEYELMLDGCRQRRPEAFAALVKRFLPAVRAVVRRRLGRRLRQRFDSQDFAQDVWASFLKVTLDRLDVPTEQALVAYLAQMAETKVVEQYRDQTALLRDHRRERRLDDTPELSGGQSPSQEAVARDGWQALTARLTPRQREMLDMIRDGHSHEAVAARFRLTAKTVQRLVDKLRRPEGL